MWYFVQEIDSLVGTECYVFYYAGRCPQGGFRRWAIDGWNWAIALEFMNYLNAR